MTLNVGIIITFFRFTNFVFFKLHTFSHDNQMHLMHIKRKVISIKIFLIIYRLWEYLPEDRHWESRRHLLCSFWHTTCNESFS
jgi:hypothetical protein